MQNRSCRSALRAPSPLISSSNGGGLYNREYNQLMPYGLTPFIGSWRDATVGKGTSKKTISSTRKGRGLLLGKNSPFNEVPVLSAIF